MVDELFIKNCISHMEDDIERWNSQIESTESDLKCMKEKLKKMQCKTIDTPQDYHGLKSEVNPTPNNLQGNKVRLQPKCRFCKNLSPDVDWVDEVLHMCNKLYSIDIVDVDDKPSELDCPYFRWIDELKEVVG
ncbi:MAG: hypothetical protein ACRDDY_04275 [Clostridium sp.]|uniref:hypothetical protein n=1 Tax=Clostridium sp. TaxID=1506 RepID=UPI003EE7FBCE